MTVGILFDEGKLTTDMRLVDLFPELEYRDRRFADVTIEHLLTMRCGVDFSEAGSVTESRWTEEFFLSAMHFAPGTAFSYNSMNSYILARVVERISERSFLSVVESRLFAPLEIKNYLWELGPEGTAKGGWGLYLSTESWAKLGRLIMCGGVFGGRRVLSEEWIRRSVTMHSAAHETFSSFGYGYQTWVSEQGEILFNGMLGQNVWICPKNDIVAVIQSGNNELFSDSPALSILRKYLRGDIKDSLHWYDVKALHERERHFFDSRAWARPLTKGRGLLYFLGIKEKQVFDKRWTDVLGTYVFAKNNIGILPLFVRGMQNNLHSSLTKLTLYRESDSLWLVFTESGQDYRLEVGLYDYVPTELDFRGERYLAKALGDHGTCQSRTHQVFLVLSTSLHGGNDHFFYEFFRQILNIDLGGAGLQSLFLQAVQFICLTHVTGYGNDLGIIIVLLQPRNDNGSIQTAGIGKNDFFNVAFLHCVFLPQKM
jgi:hypothetical protein